MSLSVLEPAPVTLSPQVKSISIINRSQATGKSRILDVADKVFTLEGAKLDKEGSEATVFALTNELSQSKRFDEVKSVTFTGAGNNSPGSYPSPLAWDEVEKICKENKSDVLFSLELFDTDSRISYSARPVKVNTPLGGLPLLEQEAIMHTLVKTGWRIYDPATKYILDESSLSKQLTYHGRGINPVMAANALIARKDAVKQVGNRAGFSYAYRVLPSWLRVGRDYFVRGNGSFKIARRKAESGNWEGAGALWLEETKAAKRKVAGRACYNMAIISEINGDVDEAIKWAQKSYEDYNIRLALRYIRVLEDRKLRNNKLEEQQLVDNANELSSFVPGSWR